MSKTYQLVRERVQRDAATDHAQYPQYAGHWEGEEWVLVRFVKNVTTKMGLAFASGDLTIARMSDDEYPTAYSRRNKIDTAVKHTDFEVVWEAVS